MPPPLLVLTEMHDGWGVASHHQEKLMTADEAAAVHSALASVSVQVSAQMTATLDIQRLVDGLGTHPHLRPLGKLLGEVEADLLRAPLHTQPCLHHGHQLEVVDLAGLRPAAP
jgi:hypothetical protein